MEKLDEMKKLILPAMIDYYGEEHQDRIADIIANTKVHEWADSQESQEIKKEEGYFLYGFDSEYLLLEKYLYDKVYVDNENGKVVDKQFIALSSKFLDTYEKKMYALVQAYIIAFMSNGSLKKNNGIYSKRRGNVYINYKEDEWGNFVPEQYISYFEDACTKYDACAITRSIVNANEEDFCFDDRYNMRDYVAILLDNPVVRNIINYGRYEHKFVTDLKDDNFTKIQSALNEDFPNIILNEYNDERRAEKLNKLFNSLLPIKEEVDNYYNTDEKQK